MKILKSLLIISLFFVFVQAVKADNLNTYCTKYQIYNDPYISGYQKVYCPTAERNTDGFYDNDLNAIDINNNYTFRQPMIFRATQSNAFPTGITQGKLTFIIKRSVACTKFDNGWDSDHLGFIIRLDFDDNRRIVSCIDMNFIGQLETPYAHYITNEDSNYIKIVTKFDVNINSSHVIQIALPNFTYSNNGNPTNIDNFVNAPQQCVLSKRYPSHQQDRYCVFPNISPGWIYINDNSIAPDYSDIQNYYNLHKFTTLTVPEPDQTGTVYQILTTSWADFNFAGAPSDYRDFNDFRILFGLYSSSVVPPTNTPIPTDIPTPTDSPIPTDTHTPTPTDSPVPLPPVCDPNRDITMTFTENLVTPALTSFRVDKNSSPYIIDLNPNNENFILDLITYSLNSAVCSGGSYDGILDDPDTFFAQRQCTFTSIPGTYNWTVNYSLTNGTGTTQCQKTSEFVVRQTAGYLVTKGGDTFLNNGFTMPSYTTYAEQSCHNDRINCLSEFLYNTNSSYNNILYSQNRFQLNNYTDQNPDLIDYDTLKTNILRRALEANVKITTYTSLVSVTMSDLFSPVDDRNIFIINDNLTTTPGTECNNAGIYFIEGNLTLSPNFTINYNGDPVLDPNPANMACLFIVKGNVTIVPGDTPGGINQFDLIHAFIIMAGDGTFLSIPEDANTDLIKIIGGIVTKNQPLTQPFPDDIYRIERTANPQAGFVPPAEEIIYEGARYIENFGDLLIDENALININELPYIDTLQ